MRRQEFAAWLGAFVLWGGVIAEYAVIVCRVNVARLGSRYKWDYRGKAQKSALDSR